MTKPRQGLEKAIEGRYYFDGAANSIPHSCLTLHIYSRREGLPPKAPPLRNQLTAPAYVDGDIPPARDLFLRLFNKIRTAKTLFRSDRAAFYQRIGFYNPLRQKLAASYLKQQGLFEFLVKGQEGEFGCGNTKLVDIQNLYSFIRRQRPSNIIEFGCGYSSIAMAHALQKNHHQYGKKGKLHIVEASPKWASNTEKKLEPFKDYVEVIQSTPTIQKVGCQLCHLFDKLPNVRPDMIYLDGPDPKDVTGSFNNISIPGLVFAFAADPLLYEWSFYPGFRMIVDGRYSNVEFLKANFKRKYRIRRNWVNDYTVFDLIR